MDITLYRQASVPNCGYGTVCPKDTFEQTTCHGSWPDKQYPKQWTACDDVHALWRFKQDTAWQECDFELELAVLDGIAVYEK